jgi:hypothetical protein
MPTFTRTYPALPTENITTDMMPITRYGMMNASKLLSAQTNQAAQYPEYVSSATRTPTQNSMYDYTPTAPLAQIQAPNYQQTGGAYQGLMGGDYNRLEENLRQPGERAATGAYNQGYNNLRQTMGGQGLYGSSIMANQATQGLDKVFQDSMANNAAGAAAQRYGLEQAGLIDMNKYNLSREQQLNQYGMNQAELNMGQAANTQQAQANESNRLMAYNEANMNRNQSYADQMRNWQNQQQYEKYAYDLAKMQSGKADMESLMNQSLALAGQGAPLISSSQQALASQNALAAQQKMAEANNAAQTQNGWLGLVGSLGGGLLGNVSYKSGTGTGSGWGFGGGN